jgi:hypothetical protein
MLAVLPSFAIKQGINIESKNDFLVDSPYKLDLLDSTISLKNSISVSTIELINSELIAAKNLASRLLPNSAI